MQIAPNMHDYKKEYGEFVLPVPEQFSFPLDIFDKWGDAPALFWTDGSTEKKFTFSELKILSSKGASALRHIGVKKADKVIVMLQNIPEWWEIMLALMRLNAIPIPSTTLLTAKDIEYRLSATDIKAIVATAEDAQKIEDAVNNSGTGTILISVGDKQGWHNYVEERDKADEFEGERTNTEDTALIYFTSGTTGLPKMVAHTQASYPMAHMITGRYWLDLRQGDLHWNLSDTGWAKAAWSSLFGPWNMGATVFSFHKKGKFDASSTIEILQRYAVTTLCGPPTAYRMIVKEIQDLKFKFRAMRHFVAAGEPLNREIIERWKAMTGNYIYDGYGQTETVNILANYRCLPIKPGSMGVPAPGFIVDVIDENGAPVTNIETEGDIAVKVKPQRPAGLFKEYIGNPDATAKTMKGSWYITGDRAYKDRDGYFWFVGRTDDIILTSGYRIGPFEIESVLIKHPAVKESAVVASPDEIRGEVVKAFIVLTQNYQPSDSLKKELQEFVKNNTAPYKYPRKIEFVSDLPKTVSGKIKRKELKIKEFSGK